MQTTDDDRDHYGIYNMKKRAADIAARFEFHSLLDQGVTIILTLDHETN